MLIAVAKFIPHQILPLIPVLTVLTILVGNIGALRQSNIKRLLAYSGIAHAGYLMIAYCALTLGQVNQVAAISIRAILFYLATYAVTNLAALFVVGYLEKSDPTVVELDGLKGLGRRNPVAAGILGLAALSLAGIPPTAGFWGKYQLFYAALFADMPVLAILGILFSVIGLFYYLRILVNCWFVPGETDEAIAATGIGARLAIGLTGAAVLVLGVLPNLLMDTLVNILL